MNGPIRMYRAREIVKQDVPVILSQCMYKLKNIHEQSKRNGVVVDSTPARSVPKNDIIQQVKQFLKDNENLHGMAELEARQEQILQQLTELKKQMDGIRSQLKVSQSTIPTQKVQASRPIEPKLDNVPDIVVNANPTNPPYSLHFIQKLWSKNANLSVKCYLHSSVARLNANALKLQGDLETFTAPATNSITVNVRLIWKNVGTDSEMFISHVPIVGEINILRYLARLCPQYLPYESLSNPNQVDSLLDLSYRLIHIKTKTDRGKLLQIFNKSLGKSEFLGEQSHITVADVAAFSAIQQNVAGNEINSNLNKWLNRCASVLQ